MENENRETHWFFRWLIALIFLLFSVITFFAFAGTEMPLFGVGYGIGILCICGAITFATRGLLRVVACSVISLSVLCMGLAYTYNQIMSGIAYSGSRAEPSIFNSIMFMLVYGVPSIGYLYKYRFGLRYAGQKTQQSN